MRALCALVMAVQDVVEGGVAEDMIGGVLGRLAQLVAVPPTVPASEALHNCMQDMRFVLAEVCLPVADKQ